MNARTIPAADHGGDQATPETHMQLAREHAALHAARLAVTRCGHNEPSSGTAMLVAARLRWHAVTQGNFCAWLEAGGFAQPLPAAPGQDDGSNENSGLRRRSHVPLRDACEELKFSLIRIRDAVE